VANCHAPYSRGGAQISSNNSFSEMWANHTSMASVDEQMRLVLRLNSLLGSPTSAPPEELKTAKAVALKGFRFTEDTNAGLYRGRLANIYWCAPLTPATAAACLLGVSHNDAARACP
jgi:hypothetical protein